MTTTTAVDATPQVLPFSAPPTKVVRLTTGQRGHHRGVTEDGKILVGLLAHGKESPPYPIEPHLIETR